MYNQNEENTELESKKSVARAPPHPAHLIVCLSQMVDLQNHSYQSSSEAPSPRYLVFEAAPVNGKETLGTGSTLEPGQYSHLCCPHRHKSGKRM
jgi:hypothetical protein